MKYLEKFPHLNKLIISDCNSITEFDVGKLSGLEDLNIFRCNNLTEISDTLCNSTSLKKICIENCPNFRSFPNILGKNLEKVLVSLQINRCGEFKSINFRSAKDDIKKVFEELY